MPWRLTVDFSDDYPAIQFFARLERKKMAEMDGEAPTKNNEWDSVFWINPRTTPRQKIDDFVSGNQWSIFCWTGDNKTVILLLLFRLAKCCGSHYRIDVRICNFVASFFAHLLFQFTHVETRSFTPSIPDTLAGLAGDFAGTCRPSLYLSWLLFAPKNDGSRLCLPKISTPSCQVRHIFTHLADSAHRRRFGRPSQSRTGNAFSFSFSNSSAQRDLRNMPIFK